MGRLKNDAIAAEDRRRKATTLGEVAAAGRAVFCWCNRCGHNSELDAGMLAARLGPALPVPEVGPRLRCSGCGAKDIATRPAWPSQGPVAGHAPARDPDDEDGAEAGDADERREAS